MGFFSLLFNKDQISRVWLIAVFFTVAPTCALELFSSSNVIMVAFAASLIIVVLLYVDCHDWFVVLPCSFYFRMMIWTVFWEMSKDWDYVYNLILFKFDPWLFWCVPGFQKAVRSSLCLINLYYIIIVRINNPRGTLQAIGCSRFFRGNRVRRLNINKCQLPIPDLVHIKDCQLL